MRQTDVLVIGGGPGGMAAAIAANKKGCSVLIIEREKRLGGILKQCIHDGFGLIQFGEKLSGPEYAERYVDQVKSEGIPYLTQTFVTKIEEDHGEYHVYLVTQNGIEECVTKSLILATGCRERTARQVMIQGTRPAGIYTAGTAQYLTNILGEMPTKKCVILGSGDIGLIMARRLTLEGASVCGVYEVKPTPSGLDRNLVQCLEDYQIPLHLSHTVTRVFGDERLTGVEVAMVDESMKVLEGTRQQIECDALILSVGLIPENEIAQSLGINIDPKTKGPLCDQHFMTSQRGIFSCGNALHVNDLVDYVSESGMLAGANAAYYVKQSIQIEKEITIQVNSEVGTIVPQRITLGKDHSNEMEDLILYIRSKRELKKAKLKFWIDDQVCFEKKLTNVKPPEMMKVQVPFSKEFVHKELILKIELLED